MLKGFTLMIVQGLQALLGGLYDQTPYGVSKRLPNSVDCPAQSQSGVCGLLENSLVDLVFGAAKLFYQLLLEFLPNRAGCGAFSGDLEGCLKRCKLVGNDRAGRFTQQIGDIPDGRLGFLELFGLSAGYGRTTRLRQTEGVQSSLSLRPFLVLFSEPTLQGPKLLGWRSVACQLVDAPNNGFE